MIGNTKYWAKLPSLHAFMARRKRTYRAKRIKRTKYIRRKRGQRGAGLLSSLISLGRTISKTAPTVARSVLRSTPKLARSLGRAALKQGVVEGVSLGANEIRHRLKRKRSS